MAGFSQAQQLLHRLLSAVYVWCQSILRPETEAESIAGFPTSRCPSGEQR